MQRTFLTTLKYHNFGLTSTLNIHLALFSFRLEIQTFLLKFRTRIPRSFGTDPAIKRNTSKVAMVKEGVLHQPSAEKDLRGGCMHTYVCISWWYLQVWNHRGGAKQKQKRVKANTQTTLRGAVRVFSSKVFLIKTLQARLIWFQNVAFLFS